MFVLLLTPLLSVHLLAANVAMAGPVVALWLEWRGTRRDDILAIRTAERLARDSVKALIVNLVLGVLLLGIYWLRGDDGYFRVWQLIPRSRLWFAIGELAFSLVLLSIYAFAWQKLSRRPWIHRTIAILGASNLIYHFPPLFAAISTLVDAPTALSEPLDRDEFRKLLFSPQVLAVSVHVWLASAAIVGTVLFFYALKLRKKNAPPNELGSQPTRIATWGARLALVATVPQILVGIWLLLTLPEKAQERLLGGVWPATIVFAIGVLLALRLMHVLAMTALGELTPRKLREATWLMIGTVVIMTATLQLDSPRSIAARNALRSNNVPVAQFQNHSQDISHGN